MRLGVVSGEPPVKARKRRRAKSEIIYIEHAGAHSGEMKYLIRAGRLIRRIEKKDGDEEIEEEEEEDDDNNST